jgi:hypothetical protein
MDRTTLPQAQDATRRLIQIAAAKPYERGQRYLPTKEPVFEEIRSLEPVEFAELAVWLFTGDVNAMSQKQNYYGTAAWEAVVNLALTQLHVGRDEAVLKVLQHMVGQPFSFDRTMAAIRSMVRRDLKRPIPKELYTEIERLGDVLMSRPEKHARLFKARREVEQALREIQSRPV